MIAGTCRLWRIDHAAGPTAFTALSPNFEPGGISPCTGWEVNTVRSIAAGGPTDSNGFSKVIYAGTDGYGPILVSSPPGGRIFVTADASVPSPIFTEVTNGINPGGYPVSDIAIDSSDLSGHTAYAAIMGFHVGHIFKTTNAGTSWTDFTGSLPDTPVNSIVVDSQAGMVYVGTDVGVFSTPSAAPNWTEVGPAALPVHTGFLPNVPVTTLRLFNANGQKLLRAATYGRGIWQYALATGPDYAIGVNNTPLTIFGSQSSSFVGALTSFNAYSSPVALACSAGVTAPPSNCTIAGSPITPTPNGAPFSAALGGAIGDYSFNIHGVGADSPSHITHDAAVILHVVDFAIGGPSPNILTIAQGNSAAVRLTVSASGSFTGTVNLACSGLPAGVACTFAPASVQPTSGNPVAVTLTVSTVSTAATGTSSLTISATTSGAPAPKSQLLNLTVTPASFTIAVSTGTQTVRSGQAAIYTLTLTPLQGMPFPGDVQLTCAPSDLLAAIAQCSFSPSQIHAGTSGSQTVTLTISTAGPASQVKPQQLMKSGPGLSLVLWVPLAGLLLEGISRRPQKRARPEAFLVLLLLPLLLVEISCGGGGSSGSASVTVSVSPPTASVYPTQTQQFIAQVTGNTNAAVKWSASAGTIDANGLYTPPLSVPNNAEATVTATSQADSSKSGSAAVSIMAMTVAINPASTSLYPTQTQQFTATVTGSTNTAVSWSLQSGGGTIDGNGLYRAASSITDNTQATIQATAQADPTKSQTALVKLNAQTPSGSYLIHVNATLGSLTQTTTASLTVQ
jgi:hypothetical protein